MHDGDAQVKEFFTEFRRHCNLANDGEGMSDAEMLLYLKDSLSGSRLENYNNLVKKSVPKLKIQEDQSVYETLMQLCTYTASLTDGITVASFNKYKGNSL